MPSNEIPVPLGARVLIKLDERPEEVGGIFVGKAAEKAHQGTVVALGDGYPAWAKENGVEIRVGDGIVFDFFNIDKVEQYHAVPLESIEAVIPNVEA